MKMWKCALALTIFSAQTLPAQEGGGPLWLVTCNNQNDISRLDCDMTQTIYAAETNQAIISINFRKSSGQEQTDATLTLPFGLLFSEGLTLSVDSNPLMRLAFLTCEAQACYARLPSSDEWLSELSTGNGLTIEAVNSRGQRLQFGFDLTGFGAAFDLLP